MKITIPQGAARIIERLETEGFEAYVVGGCVRDSLLFRSPGDWDITTNARPEQVKALFAKTVDTGIEHGTVTVLIEQGSYEVTTYRIDGLYLDGRHPTSVSFTGLLAEDLKRRDFTVNAMAYHPVRGLVDLYGGLEDLKAQVIRAVGEPEERFTEDALRMLRAVRFCTQLGFSMEAGTRAAIGRLSERLQLVSKERIQAELFKILSSRYPQQYLACYELGLIGGMDSSLSDLPEHSRQELGGLLTDLAKLYAPEQAEDQPEPGICDREQLYLGLCLILRYFYAGDRQVFGDIFRRLHIDNETRRHVITVVCHEASDLEKQPVKIRRLLAAVGEVDLRLLSRLRGLTDGHADRDYQNAISAILDANDAFRIDMLAVDGYNIIERYQCRGKHIGELLSMALEMVIEDPAQNRREAIFAYLDARAAVSLRKENEV